MNKKDIDRIEAAARRGAIWLDSKQPGWYREIDLEDFDMHSDYMCVLGQLEGSYVEGLRKYGLDVLAPIRYKTPTCWYGFTLPYEMCLLSQVFRLDAWGRLDQAWEFEIRARRRKDSLTVPAQATYSGPNVMVVSYNEVE